MATSKTAKFLLIGGGLLFVVLIIGIIAIALFADTMGRPSVPDNSVLVLSVSGALPDYVPEDQLTKALGIGQQQSFTSLMTQIRKAKVDNRIGGVLLDINFPGIGWGKADELRDAITDLRGSGKPVYAYLEIGTNREYYIATAAEKIFVAPPGDLYINGFAAEAMFYKGSLDKLGVEADVIQIGPKYKNAPDAYTRKEMSDGQREVINALLDEYFTRFTTAIAETRKKSVDDVKALVDNAPYTATQAKTQGLIDDAIYREQVDEQFKTRLGYKSDDKLRTIRGSQYRDIPSDSLGLNKGERVAVIYASGAINVGRSSSGPINGEMVGSDTIVTAVNDAANDKSIKAIVLRVDSPGGSALASDLMWYALENAKAKKPVVVSMGDVAASGGYYIACNANKIVAQPSTVTGSIGVFMGKPVVKGLYDWLGVTNEYVMRGKNAGLFRETEKWTPEERAKMVDQTNSIYFDNFIPKVAKGRNKTVEDANTLGQGRVWTGTQAKQSGLIDEFGGLEKAIEIAKQLANLPADKDVKRVIFPEPRPFLETLFGGDASAQTREEQTRAAILEALPADVRRSFRYASLFDRMQKGEAMLLMPFELEIK
ncbi:MAG TPA: signal peptide peptidase SppA [Pyrinomonadaceae bacterium]|nr:signal peptide peptidase SppA [Chloracidobacterium sp.]MBP9935105.1 signal peptide peptidase SppA [Pyrinomonadaceae bacterium]MBK7803469.1 signal peptide peptidase SppA [Chloracidobacterium sp.]MBK9438718.1 signal peptide peptidase SppA [Chloracidobacterium sp.]MBL0241244.1 signal peptide peptidase SppA [Chloracidobacterium sp.]